MMASMHPNLPEKTNMHENVACLAYTCIHTCKPAGFEEKNRQLTNKYNALCLHTSLNSCMLILATTVYISDFVSETVYSN